MMPFLSENNRSNLTSERFSNEIVKHHHDTLIKVAKAIVGENDAEEIVQESWISIFKSIDKFRGSSSLKTWMCRITMNKAISHIRKNGEKTKLDNFSELIDENQKSNTLEKNIEKKSSDFIHETNPENILYGYQLHNHIVNSIKKLPKKQKICFQLSHFSNNDTQTISSLLDESIANTKVLTHRARTTIIKKISHFQAQ